MAYKYDKDEIKESLTIEQVFDLLVDLGAEPQMLNNYIICQTICHNHPGEGSRKLYYYNNTKLFKCYTDCGDYFDIYQLISKIKELETGEEFTLGYSLYYIASRFGFELKLTEDENEDWKIFKNYDRIKEIDLSKQEVELKEYNKNILQCFSYPIIEPWIQEGISQEVLTKYKIGYYPTTCAITIPHYDINNRLVGVRGRTLVSSEADIFGKYRPLIVAGNMYNHPLGFNLYGLNESKENIKTMKKVIVFESEKSVLLYESYFGIGNNLSVAVCGSSLSTYHFETLLECGASEIIIAFDRQYQEIGDIEFQRWTKHLIDISNKYSSKALISFMFDKESVLPYKASPIDCGKEKFLYLFKNRIIL